MSLNWQKPAPSQAGDPYLDWALATQWQGFPTAAPANCAALWVPLIARRGPAWDGLLAREGPLLKASALKNPAAGAWGTLWAQSGCLARVHAELPGCELSQPVPVRFAAARKPTPRRPQPGEPAIPLVLGTIDRGGAFLNQTFLAPGRKGACRILSYWDQEALAPDERASPWVVAPAGYGRELTRAALLKLHKLSGRDSRKEAALYKALGLADLVAAAASEQPDHATHVLDTLAGLPPKRRHKANAKPMQADAAAEAPLILVSVPASLPGQTTGAAGVAQILDALHHILNEADAVAPQAAVVVNISLGALAGPHDGSSALEQAIDALMRARPRLLVVFAAGNNGGDLLSDPTSGTNAGGSLAPGASANLSWRLQPGDPTDSFLEFWWAGKKASTKALQTPSAGLQVRVLEPVASDWLSPGEQMDLFNGEQLLGRLHLQTLNPKRGRRCGRGQLSLAPVQGERGGVPAGRWRVELRNASRQVLDVDVRVQGDLPRWTDPSPVQSVLVDAQGLGLGQAGSLNGLATGDLPLMVGAAHTDDDRDSLYTARPKALGPRRDLVRAVADEGPLAYGLIAAGVLSGSEARMGGTSVAAPVAARHWANRLARGGQPEAPERWLNFLYEEVGHSSAAKRQQVRRPARALRPKP